MGATETTGDRDNKAAERPGGDARFRVWWSAFLADWHRRYPTTPPPSEDAARVAFYEAETARERSHAPAGLPAGESRVPRTGRWERPA